MHREQTEVIISWAITDKLGVRYDGLLSIKDDYLLTEQDTRKDQTLQCLKQAFHWPEMASQVQT